MRDFWNARYADSSYLFGTEPNAFLVSRADLLKRGQKVLAVADGEGRNGVWLARQGLDVLAVDISPIALEKAGRLAEQAGVVLETQVVDLLSWDWGKDRFDAIVAIFIQFVGSRERQLIHRRIVEALKPGGYLILQGYTPKQLEYGTGGPTSADNLYTGETLRGEFPSLDIRHLREHEEVICEGKGHCGMSALVDMVARKS